jgi:fructokinase
MSETRLILGVGELLWDVLPEGARLGGAPANFAVMSARLGDRAAILSRIGRDELGRQAIERLEPLPVDTSLVEVDGTRETGRVTVRFEGNEPHYTIHEPAAWDFLEFSDEWIRLAERADAVCFGSLAQRTETSRKTIQELVAQTSAACVRVFDVNLRRPFYSGEVLQESLELASVLKMNEAEAPLVMELLGMPVQQGFADDGIGLARKEAQSETGFLRRAAERFLAEFPELGLVAITKGGRGSLLVTRDEWNEHHGFPVKVADAVGAGDAFTAAMVHYLLRGASLATLNEAGNRWGGWMASQTGAMPALPDAVRTAIAAAIEAVN